MLKTFTYSILIVLAICLLLIGIWKLSKSRTFQFFGDTVTRVDTDEPVIALTLDDGPTATHTPTVLQILREKGVKATFFVTGAETLRNLPYAKMIVEDGHELGNHTFSHKRMIFKSLSFVEKEIEATDEAIRKAGYRGYIYFRPTYAQKLVMLPWYLEKSGRESILWDIEPESYKEIAHKPARIAEHVVQRAAPGSIILLHVMYNAREDTRIALPLVIDRLKEEGFRFVTVSELMAVRRG